MLTEPASLGTVARATDQRPVRPGLGFGRFWTARRILADYEMMAMVKKRRRIDPTLFTEAGENRCQFPDFPLLATEELDYLPRHMRHPLGETPPTQPIEWPF